MEGHLNCAIKQRSCSIASNGDRAHPIFDSMKNFLSAGAICLCSTVVCGQFADERIIAPLERVGDRLAGDVDGDGLNDLVICGNEGPIFLYRGAGNGAFLPPETIGLHGYYAEEQSGLVDVDGDLDLDVLYHDGFDAMRLLRNDGSGGFAPAEDLFLLYSFVNDAMELADLDGDADVDIIFSIDSNNDDRIVWYANDGSGAFTSMGTVALSTNGCRWVRSADLDGDGDVDLISSRASDGKILRYDNNGSGSFSAATLLTSGALNDVERCRTADLNMDGREDICFNDGSDHVRLVLSDTSGFQAPVLLYSRQGIPPIGDIRLADMDANGTTDVVFGGGALIGYFNNPGNASFSIIPDTLVRFPRSSAGTSFITSDLNNNGVQDIVLRANNTLVYFQDQAGAPMQGLEVVSRGMNETNLLMADLDLDGDPDALAVESYLSDAGGSIILAAFNDGTGIFTRPDTLVDHDLDLGWVRPPWQVHDMDDDGDPDILFMDVRDDATSNLNWLVNNGTGYYDSLVVLLEGPEAFELTDLDMDGQEDLIAISTSTGSETGWYRGLGAGAFSNFNSLGVGLFGNDVTTADPDNDGDLDIMTTSGSGQFVVVRIHENQGGGVFSLLPGLFTTNYGDELHLVDLDGDALSDVLVTTIFDNGITWFKNMGGLQFQFEANILNANDLDPVLADMDADGDTDILFTMAASQGIHWIQNLGAGNFATATEVVAVHGIPSGVSIVDVDGNGLLDLAYSLLPDSTSGAFAYTQGWIGGTGIVLSATAIAPNEATIYPLPLAHSATIQLKVPLGSNEQLVVTDGTGRVVRILHGAGSDRIVLERGDLVAGVYLIHKRSAKDEVCVGRVVVE